MDISALRPNGPQPFGQSPRQTQTTASADLRAMRTAEDFEAAFLTEMLKYSGINAMPDGFGGGAGEDAFASFLTQEYASLMAERGGIGLAEQIFAAMTQGNRTE